jgi:hypothetical protein
VTFAEAGIVRTVSQSICERKKEGGESGHDIYLLSIPQIPSSAIFLYIFFFFFFFFFLRPTIKIKTSRHKRRRDVKDPLLDHPT